MPHTLVHGPDGAGKRTHVAAMLHAMFHLSAADVALHTVEVGGLRVPMSQSPWHIQYSAATTVGPGTADKVVALDAIQRAFALSSSCAMFLHKAGGGGGGGGGGSGCGPTTGCLPLLIIENADCLSRAAQCALRWPMEAVSAKCRVVFVSSRPNRLISALKSRCCVVAVPAPSVHAIAALMRRVADAEGVPTEVLARAQDTVAANPVAARHATAVLCRLQDAYTGGLTMTSSATSGVATAWHRDVAKLAHAIDSGGDAATTKPLVAKLTQAGVPASLLLQSLTVAVCGSPRWFALFAAKPATEAAVVIEAATYVRKTNAGNNLVWCFKFAGAFITLLSFPPQDHRVATSPEAFEAHVEAFVAFLVNAAKK
jgi:hypothetical protein